MNKEYIIFAGVNGAGKSTFYNHIKRFPQIMFKFKCEWFDKYIFET